uniref:Uncharacterized protein n=1 Tax=viral metagenome TaxID=1070528 RepID=A0A6C0C9Q8_9ZZZZ
MLLPRIIIGWRFACQFNRSLKLHAMLLPRFAYQFNRSSKLQILPPKFVTD